MDWLSVAACHEVATSPPLRIDRIAHQQQITGMRNRAHHCQVVSVGSRAGGDRHDCLPNRLSIYVIQPGAERNCVVGLYLVNRFVERRGGDIGFCIGVVMLAWFRWHLGDDMEGTCYVGGRSEERRVGKERRSRWS